MKYGIHLKDKGLWDFNFSVIEDFDFVELPISWISKSSTNETKRIIEKLQKHDIWLQSLYLDQGSLHESALAVSELSGMYSALELDFFYMPWAAETGLKELKEHDQIFDEVRQNLKNMYWKMAFMPKNPFEGLILVNHFDELQLLDMGIHIVIDLQTLFSKTELVMALLDKLAMFYITLRLNGILLMVHKKWM